MAVHIGQAKVTTVIPVGEFLVVEAELVHNGGMQVVHVHLALHGMVAVLVGITMGETRLETTTRKANGEAIRVMIASGTLVLRVGRSAKFAAPPYDGVIK